MKGELEIGEHHPAAQEAFAWIKAHNLQELSMWLESFSSCAIEGNRLAELCAETLGRIMDGKPVGERYVLGLAWTLRNMEKEKSK